MFAECLGTRVALADAAGHRWYAGDISAIRLLFQYDGEPHRFPPTGREAHARYGRFYLTVSAVASDQRDARLAYSPKYACCTRGSLSSAAAESPIVIEPVSIT